MTLPTVSGTIAVANDAANATSHVLNVPGTVATDERLIMAVACDGNPTITWPAGWTQILLGAAPGSLATIEVRYKDVTNPLTDNADITVTTSASEIVANICARIAGADLTTAPAVSTLATGTSTAPNPPSLDPSGWGAEDTLWLAIVGYDDGTATTSAYPTSYINGTNERSNRTNGVGVGFATRGLNATSEDPAAFTLSASQAWGALTIGIRPVGAPTATITHHKNGAVTTGGFTGVCKIASATGNVRMVVSTTSDLATSPVFSSSVTPDAQAMVKASVTGLSANTQYYYGWEESGTVLATGRGTCKTLTSGAHSFNFAHASCQDANSTNTVFTTIKNRNPAIFIHTGDISYANVNSTTASLYRAEYDTNMAQTVQQGLYANVPMAYVYDDHDFAGQDSDSTFTGAATAPVVYRQYTPHYPLVESTTSEGVYHTFDIGRCKFIMLDLRRYRSPAANTDNSSKTMLGANQKAWLKSLLLANRYQLKFMISTVFWHDNLTGNDKWGAYQTERTELVNFFADNDIKNIVVVGGDMHAVASDDGRNSPGRLPLLYAAPLDRPSNLTSTTFQNGPIPSSDDVTSHQYGYVQVTDTGGGSISVTYQAYDQSDTALLTALNLTFQVTPAQGVGAVQMQT